MTTKAYEDLLSNTMAEPMFNSLVERTKKESEDLMKQITHDERKLVKNSSVNGNARKWIDIIKEYADITELDMLHGDWHFKDAYEYFTNLVAEYEDED